jgi:hypothetical protein
VQPEWEQYADLVELEATFAQGDAEAFDRARARIEPDPDGAHQAASLVIRWCDQFAANNR